MKSVLLIICCLILACTQNSRAQWLSYEMRSQPLLTEFKPGPGLQAPELSAIRETDLKQDIFKLAGDSFRGRRAGTLDEMRAGVWVAQQAEKAGLKPAGDDGTFFQFFNIHRNRIASTSTFQLVDKQLQLWKDFWVAQPVDSHLDAPILWLQSMADTAKDLQGKIVAMNFMTPSPLPARGMSLWGYRYTAFGLRQQAAVLRRKGAVAVVIVADQTVEEAFPFAGHNYAEGQYLLDGSVPPISPQPPAVKTIPVILIRSTFGPALSHTVPSRVKIDLKSESFLYPSVNVVAVASGTDPVLKKQYVLFSGHHDHDGVGTAIDRDSIWNGADDNASVSVALLAIARAWTRHPGKRSALFVWHGAEERGLLGSRWYASHPTVDRQAIAAVLNGDMIGRNAPDSAALLGTLLPHRNSQELVAMAMSANTLVSQFKVDFSWDDAKHPENWWFRSDHLPYAQAGIPSLFFTTLLHADYHTPRDEPNRIDITKLAKMSRWMYATGWQVSETPVRPRFDPPLAEAAK